MIGVSTQQSVQSGKALPVQVSHSFTPDSAVFDDDNLVSLAGLVPVMTLAEQTALPELLADGVCIAEPKIKSGSANPAPKLVTLIAGMCAGADSIDDLDMLRSGGMKTLFGGVYAPSTIGTLLREFSFGHARQLESVLRHHLSELCDRVELLSGAEVRAFVDIDSLLRPVYGHAKQGASYGHSKIAGKQVLRKGLSPLVATISTDTAAPVIAGMRLRAGKSGSGKGAGRMVAQAVATARAAGVTGQILVRADSAYGTRAVVGACRRVGAGFSLVLTKNTKVRAAIEQIPEHAWTPVRYPGAVRDPDTGAWISDAEVAEIPYTAFASTSGGVTARLIVRRVKDARHPDALFPVWRYHPFFTDSTEPVTDADITHRRHAIIETVFADLIDGPLAHMPSGHFGANSAWILCAAIAHNLLRAAGTLAGGPHAVARGATLRRKIVNIPARLARPQRRPVLHLPRACLLIPNCRARPDDRRGEENAAEKANSVLVVARGYAAPLLEPVEAALDGVALLVDCGVEGGWAATGRALGLAPGDLVVTLGDRVLDPTTAQRRAGGRMRVGLIGEQPHIAGTVAGLLCAEIAVDQRQQLRVVPCLPGGEQHRHRAGRGVGQGMELRGQPAAGAAQSVVVGLADRRILVIQLSPLCHPQLARLPRADAPAPRSSPPTIAAAHPRRARRRPNRRGRHQGSVDRCRRTKTGGGVSKPSAMARNRPADPATVHRCGTATLSPPRSADDRRTDGRACPHPTASTAPRLTRTHPKSLPHAS